MNTIKQKDIQEKKSKVFISFVLDESGSMSTGKDAIVSGMNEQIQTLKSKFKDTQTEVVVSFVKFADNIISLYEGKTLEDLREFESHAYRPNGSTALYDATGYTLDMMQKMEGIDEDDTTCLVLICTDGEENASKHFNAKQIAERIQTLNNTKRWTITYLGPNNVDLSKVKQGINTSYGNMLRADLTSSRGYTQAFASVNSNLGAWASNVSFNAISGCSFASNSFYDLDKTNGTIGAQSVSGQASQPTVAIIGSSASSQGGTANSSTVK